MSVNYPPSCPQHLSLRAKLKPSCRRKLRGSIWSWRQRLQYFYWRLVRIQGKPEAIARGLACGVFAGLFPIFEFQTIVGVFLVFIFPGNKILAAAGTWISNPLSF